MTATGFRLYLPEECTGRDGYPPAWHAELKHAVRETAGHRCIRCGHPYRRGEQGTGEWTPCDESCSHFAPVRIRVDDGPWTIREQGEVGPQDYRLGRVHVEARWRILTVHHLDGVKGNCRWWNLVALCQRCHLQIQGKVRMERIWSWEHSEWFKPYVAGFYAWHYLREDLTREQVEARLDELLDLERLTTERCA